MKKLSLLSVISVVSMFIWYVKSYSGGAFIYLFEYGIILILMIIVYISTLFVTIYRFLSGNDLNNSISKWAHGIFIILLIGSGIYHSELFKSNIVLRARLNDDLYSYTLNFRTDGTVSTNIVGMFGYSESIDGSYRFVDSLVVFDNVPYENDFIPDTLLVDQSTNAIYMTKDRNGNFSKEKTWLSYFEIL